jgi:hypothetical protein
MIGAITAGLFSTGAAASGGTSYESIATYTATTTTASFTFSSIPSTFKHLQVRAMGRTNRANVEDGLYIQLNGDTAGNYNAHILYGTGATAGSALATTTTDTKIESYGMPGNNATASIFGVAVLDILDYTNTNKYTVTRSLTGDDRNGSGWIELNSGLWRNTAAVNEIKIFAIGSWLQYSSFALYGIKG